MITLKYTFVVLMISDISMIVAVLVHLQFDCTVSMFIELVVLEMVTFCCFISFYQCGSVIFVWIN